jgi:multimeric flavodoxin WrbA
MSDGLCAIRDDDFPALWRDLHSAEVIVQACPVYWHAPPGLMKDFIDRSHSTYPDKGYLEGKRAYTLTVGADSGFETCEVVMASWVTAYGGKVLGSARLLARDLGELEGRPDNLRRLEELANLILAGA